MDDAKRKVTRGQLTFLEQQLSWWVDRGLVTGEQREGILERYDAGEARPERRRVAVILPAILIGLAVVLIGVGLILFYAANWRKMMPGLKLAQVFGVLLASYGGSYYLIFRRRLLLAGRGLLLLGMISFGAAIGLIAQIFHISAHPANGVLLWLVGTLALAAVMEERWGYYLAAVLAMVWNCWELFVYNNANYVFVLFVAVLFYLFYRKGDPVGQLLAAFEGLFWLFQINAHFVAEIADADGPWGAAVVAALLLQLPLGVVLVALRGIAKPAALELPLAVLGALGWVLLFLPLIGLSWPMELDPRFLFFGRLQLPFALQHGLLLVAGAALVGVLRRQGQPTWLPAACLGFGALVLVAPLGYKPVLLVVTHVGLLGLILGLLVFSHGPGGRTVDRVFALLFAISALVVKGVGLLGLAAVNRQYFVAYCMGFVVFATVLFLINQYVRDHLTATARPDSARYLGGVLDGLCALAAFLMLYAVSFKLREQDSVFQADPVVLLLVGLFIVLALGFYVVLWRRGSARLPLGLSAIVFGVATIILLVAGPSIPWQVYSVAFNLLLLLFEGVLLYYATRINSTVVANIAIAAFALQVFTRYVDIFWDLLSGSLLFIITGLVVFGGGFFLELNRRKVTRRIRRAERAATAAGQPGRREP